MVLYLSLRNRNFSLDAAPDRFVILNDETIPLLPWTHNSIAVGTLFSCPSRSGYLFWYILHSLSSRPAGLVDPLLNHLPVEQRVTWCLIDILVISRADLQHLQLLFLCMARSVVFQHPLFCCRCQTGEVVFHRLQPFWRKVTRSKNYLYSHCRGCDQSCMQLKVGSRTEWK